MSLDTLGNLYFGIDGNYDHYSNQVNYGCHNNCGNYGIHSDHKSYRLQ